MRSGPRGSVTTEDRDRPQEPPADHGASEQPRWGDERYVRPDPAPPPPSTPEPDPTSTPEPDPTTSPVPSSVRGRHIAWARLERVAPPPPPPQLPPTRPAGTWSAPAPPIAPPSFDDAAPTALGRLIALIVTCGIGWALGVAILVWVLVFFLTRAGG